MKDLSEYEEESSTKPALQEARSADRSRQNSAGTVLERPGPHGWSSSHIAHVLESITDAFFALDNDWRFTYINERANEMVRPMQKTKETLIGRSIWTEFPELKGTILEENYRRAMTTRQTIDFEAHYPRLDAWFDVRAYPLQEGLSIYLHNITKRKRAEEALRVSEQRFRATFNQAAVGMAMANLNGAFTEVNERFAEILGYSAEQLLSRTFLELTHPDDLARTESNVRDLLSGKAAEYTMEKRYIRQDGTIVWSFTAVTLLRDSAGEPEHFAGVIEDITQRKMAEQALRESAARLQLALSSGHLGDWSWDAHTDMVTLGPEASGLFGLPPGPPITWAMLRELLHPDDQERARAAVEEAVRSGTDYSIEYRVDRGGQWRWIAARGRAIYGADRKVLGMTGVVQEITDRKSAEEAHSRLAAVVESSDDAIISMTLEAVIVTWNKGAERTFGYTAAEAVGNSIVMLIPPDRKDEESIIFERLKRGERVEHYETVRLRKDGSPLQVSLTVSAIYDGAGKMVGVSKISRDITERKRAEEKLREETRILELLNETGKAIASQLELQALLQTVTDAGTKLSGAKFGAFFYNVVNPEGESLALYTLSGAPREAFANFQLPRNTAVFEPTFRGEGVVRSDDITKDPRYGKMAPHYGMPKGHLPVRSYLAVPVKSRDGEVLGGLFFAHPEVGVFTGRVERVIVGVAAQAAVAIDNARLYDAAQKEITERRRAQEALREAQDALSRHAEDLEKKVAERTATLRDTIGDLETFSYSISHDLRAPLRAVQSFSQILAEDCADQVGEEGKEYIRRITTATERMDRLIQDVLTFSRVSRTELPLVPLDPGKLIRDITESYPTLQEPNAEIRVTGPFPRVIAAEALLTQCISNLLGNAVKFVPPGVKPVVEVWGGTVPELNAVRLYFKDNGVGIEKEMHTSIFGMFQRLSNRYEGTGIGLAIVKKAAERMGGTVGLESEPGKGSTFWLELKAAP